jgi:NAD(P)-dependent dehydrogenase (short-subunit alcohol dehydrogenase family)
MTSLKNKVAIITGASSGIGRATAKLFTKEGAQVIVGARRENELNVLVNEVKQDGGEAIALAGDVTSEDYVKTLVELAVSEYGRLDVAFNNAGILGDIIATTKKTKEDWQHELNTNLTSGFLGAKYQIPVMEKTGGSIIFCRIFGGYATNGCLCGQQGRFNWLN